MMLLNKWSLFIAVSLVGILGIRFYQSITDGFQVTHISHQLDFTPSLKTPDLSKTEQEHLKKVLSQTYTYLGKGAQCYAFVSADQQYVLKFFKFKNFKPHFLIKYLPSISPFHHYKELYLQRKKKKLLSVFEGYDVAYQHNQQESGLLYLHFKPTTFLDQSVTLIDKMGLSHTVQIDPLVFLVQKKGETFGMRLKNVLEKNDQKKAKQAISTIIAMYMQEYQKGIYDRDHAVIDNTGFVGEVPFHLDVGKLTQDSQIKQIKFYKKDLYLVVGKIDQWIKKNYPAHYKTLSKHLADDYYSWIGEAFDPNQIDVNYHQKNRHALVQAND
jgi:hypothetical protein